MISFIDCFSTDDAKPSDDAAVDGQPNGSEHDVQSRCHAPVDYQQPPDEGSHGGMNDYEIVRQL